MSTSMEDVARQAGVSKSTVSLVLNERPGVSEEMRARVMAAATEVGYRLPGQREAASARRSLTDAHTIALVHCVSPEPDVDPGLTQLYLAYRNGIQRFAQGQDISVMLVTNYQDADVDNLSYQLLVQQEAMLDGLILMGPGLRRESQLIQRVLTHQIPTVILGRRWVDMPISSVSQDHREQARIALDHLFALGHRQIGFVAREIDRNYHWYARRLEAFQQKMAEQTSLYPETEAHLAVEATVEEGVGRLLTDHPGVTALLAMNDHIAYQAMQTAILAGRTVPGDLSVVGIDGAIRRKEDLPALTTVAFPHEEVGYLAAELLIKQLENQHLRNACLTVRSELITGGSTKELNDKR